MPNPNNPHGFIAEFMFGSGAIPLWYGVLKSAAVVTDGDCVKATVGLIMKNMAVATDDPKIIGVAAETRTAPATARDTITFVPALENIVFSGQYGTNVGAGQQLTQGIMYAGRNLGPAALGTGVMRLSTGVSSVACIIGLKRTSAFGTFGEALFIFGVSRMSGRGIY